MLSARHSLKSPWVLIYMQFVSLLAGLTLDGGFMSPMSPPEMKPDTAMLDGLRDDATSPPTFKNYPPNHPLSGSKHLCSICGDRASGKHYGVYRYVSAWNSCIFTRYGLTIDLVDYSEIPIIYFHKLFLSVCSVNFRVVCYDEFCLLIFAFQALFKIFDPQ